MTETYPYSKKPPYPYIPKEYYAAVMGACRWISDSGYFNKATEYYADKYNLDVEEVRKHVRARQSVGQKGKARGTYKKFRFKGHFELRRRESFWGENTFDIVIKALSYNNALSRLDEKVLLRKPDFFEDDIIYTFEIKGEVVE